MNGCNTKMELLGSAPIPKALVALGLPTMVGMLINALYNLVDTYFVGAWAPTRWEQSRWPFLLDRLWWGLACCLEMALLPVFQGFLDAGTGIVPTKWPAPLYTAAFPSGQLLFAAP